MRRERYYWTIGVGALALLAAGALGARWNGSPSVVGADAVGCGGAEPTMDSTHPWRPAEPPARADPDRDLPGLGGRPSEFPSLKAPPAPPRDTCIAGPASLRIGPLSGRLGRITIVANGTVGVPGEVTLEPEVPATATSWPYRFNSASRAEMDGDCLRVEAWTWSFDVPHGFVLEGALHVEQGYVVYRAVEKGLTGGEVRHAFRVTREAGTPGWVFREDFDPSLPTSTMRLVGFVLLPHDEAAPPFDPAVGACDPNAPTIRFGHLRFVPSYVWARLAITTSLVVDVRLEPGGESPLSGHDVRLSGGTALRVDGACVTLMVELLVNGDVRATTLTGQLVLDEEQRLAYHAAARFGEDVSDLPRFDVARGTAPMSAFHFHRSNLHATTRTDLVVTAFASLPVD